jgi:hypothetical protein
MTRMPHPDMLLDTIFGGLVVTVVRKKDEGPNMMQGQVIWAVWFHQHWPREAVPAKLVSIVKICL